MTPETLLQELQKKFPGHVAKASPPWETKGTSLSLKISQEKVLEICASLKKNHAFDFLDFITAVDWKGPVDTQGYITDPNPNPFLPAGATPQAPPSPPTPGVPYREFFEVVYCLSSWENRQKLLLKAEIPRSRPRIPSLTSLWKAADLQEREAYDLMGIEFTGHPNLKKILTPEFIQGHPLRKDYVHQKDPYD